LLRAFLRPYRKAVAWVALLQLAQTLAALYLPTLNAQIIDNGVLNGDSGYIVRVGVVMLGVSLAQVACLVGVTRFGARVAMAVARDMRAALFDRVLAFSAREVGQFGTSSLTMRTTNDVQQVQTLLVMALTLAASAPIMGVGAVLMALNQSVQLSGLLVVVVPVLGTVLALIIAGMRPKFRLMQKRIDVMNRILREQITGIRVVRAFVREGFERERFRRANEDLYQVAARGGRVMGLMFPSVMAVINLASVAVVWFGAELISDGAMQVGALSAFLSYLMQVLLAVMTATFMFIMAPRAEISAERIHQVLDTPSSVLPPRHNPILAVPERGRLELSMVEFRYAGAEQPVLRNINLAAGPGDVIGIIGGTGSGKSTLLSLIPRLFDVTGGSVAVGGVNVGDLAPRALARSVGLVSQHPYLFSGTIASNLRYGNPDADDGELWNALEVAQAREFVERLPDGLGTRISQGGTTLSGGQRQRLAIAMTLVQRPDIYLFDDCFSALDYATDAALRAALAAETAQGTVVIAAQRVSTIRHADRILVLDKGEIADSGSHEQLMEANATYREIVMSQVTRDVVA
jgi:ATP-binding cassette subfamily B protein